ncbi:hypothetical protein ASC95_08755 [Pelomonas sp. Root1217]|nr:hypothetical protein ASC95_08755 [Pelomonas sp. Root1217]
MDKVTSNREPEQLMLWDAFTALPEGGTPDQEPEPGVIERHKLQFVLGSLGPRLRAEARRQRTTMADIVRRATLKMLDDIQGRMDAGGIAQPFEHSARNVHFHLHMPPAFATELTERARAAFMTRGEFVWSLLKGISPPALPLDHAAAVQALRNSTDRLAALSTDLSELLRLFARQTPTSESLASQQANVRSLDHEVRNHLRTASVLIAELKPYRRPRW